MKEIEGFDHVAIAVPNLIDEVERLTTMMGMVIQASSEHHALLADRTSGFQIELTESTDGQSHFRHLGFRATDVQAAHNALVEAGMESTEKPHRREFAKMFTSFLKETSGLEIQLVKYD